MNSSVFKLMLLMSQLVSVRFSSAHVSLRCIHGSRVTGSWPVSHLDLTVAGNFSRNFIKIAFIFNSHFLIIDSLSEQPQSRH